MRLRSNKSEILASCCISCVHRVIPTISPLTDADQLEWSSDAVQGRLEDCPEG